MMVEFYQISMIYMKSLQIAICMYFLQIVCNSMFFTTSYKSKTTFGTGFFNILPILELTLTASMSTGQNRSSESDVES